MFGFCILYFFILYFWYRKLNYSSKVQQDMSLRIVLSILVLLPIGEVAFAQQDVVLTNFWNNLSVFNPAAAGLSYRQQAAVNASNNWIDHYSIAAGYSAKLAKCRSGIGFNYHYNTDRLISSNRVDLNYSYHFDLGKGRTLAAGVSAGVSKQKFSDILSNYPGLPYEALNDGYAFLSNAGVIYKAKNLSLGVSSTQLLTARIDDVSYLRARNYYLFGSYNFNLSDKFALKPQVLLSAQSGFYSADYNLLATYNNRYWAGVTYRTRETFAFLVGVDIKERYRVGYSYGATRSRLNNGISRGMHEIVLGFLLK